MTLACLAAFIFWNKLTRLLMLPLFGLAIIVGGMGVYFHNDGNFKRVITTSIHAWTDPTMHHPDSPPHNAPLAYAGLGLIGIHTPFKPYNPTDVATEPTTRNRKHPFEMGTSH